MALLRVVRRSRVVRLLAARLPVPIKNRLSHIVQRLSASTTSSGPYKIRPASFGLRAHFQTGTSEMFRTNSVARVRRGPADLEVTSESVSGLFWPIPDRLIPFGVDQSTPRAFLEFTERLKKSTREPLDPRLLHGWQVRGWAPPAPEMIRRNPDQFRLQVHKHIGIVDGAVRRAAGPFGSHKDAQTRAFLLACAAAAGTPVSLGSSEGLTQFLPSEVLDTMTSAQPSQFLEDSERIRVAFRQWSAVHDHLGMYPTWAQIAQRSGVGAKMPETISVSVILATNRPDMIANWAPQLAVQQWDNLEVIAALHGDGFTPRDEAAIVEALGDRVKIVRCSSDQVLGDLLNAATAMAEGQIIVKWDDDDLYSRRHIADMVRSLRYSGCQLVGKACEYVYLSSVDVTVQRIQGPREMLSTTMAGGTLCIGRDDLASLGGWTPAPRRVDSLLIERVLASGGQTYRAIGFGYMMMRSVDPAQHTWAVGDDTFLKITNPQRRGIATDWAMVDPPEEVMQLWSR